MNARKWSLLVGISVLILGVIACTINVGGPDYPDQHIPISTNALGDFQSAMQTAAAAGVESGEITLAIDESQITSFLANKLQSQSQPLFTDPQVYLRDGKIQIYGTAKRGYLIATIEIVLTAGIDEQGQLKVELTSADFGPLPVPAGLKDIITASIQELYTGAIGPLATGFRLEDITIANGEMSISGQPK